MLDEPLAAWTVPCANSSCRTCGAFLTKPISLPFMSHTTRKKPIRLADRILLIHNGIIEQAGPPDQVYQNPRTPWVAEFLGMKNRIHGTVTQADR